MKGKVLWIVAPLVIAVLATAAVAIAPTVLNSSSPATQAGDATPTPIGSAPPTATPPARSAPLIQLPPVPGISPNPQPGMTILAPAWKTGDAWVYNVTLKSVEDGLLTPEAIALHGQLTKTVAGIVSTPAGSAYNVTLDGTFALGGTMSLGLDRPTILDTDLVQLSTASLTGYLWYRTSDFAKIVEVRTLDLSGAVTADNRTINVSFTATTEIWYNPPLVQWVFPLKADETWNDTTNATVRYWSSYRLQSPMLTFASNRSLNVTVPMRLVLRTGIFENVTTPAGTFLALPVATFTPATEVELPDRIAAQVLNLSEDPVIVPPTALGEMWFSAKVGNVVAQRGWVGLDHTMRLDMVLVSYTYG